MPIIKANKGMNLKEMLRFPFNIENRVQIRPHITVKSQSLPRPLKKKKKKPPNKEDRVKLSILCHMTPVR